MGKSQAKRHFNMYLLRAYNFTIDRGEIGDKKRVGQTEVVLAWIQRRVVPNTVNPLVPYDHKTTLSV
jgi:hypothetical protein